MSYKINKTDGELLIELADGQIDTTSTDITLIGRNYKGFGELFNENFVQMLENFASTAPPGSPLQGQLWYDTSQGRLKVYDGSSFKANGPIISNTQPSMVAGDIWIDNENNKMYFYDGTDLVLVGPEYNAGQGQTGFEVSSVIDISSRERVILKIWVGGTLFGVIANEEFRLRGDNKIAGYPDDPDDVVVPARQLILKGFNLVSEDYWYQGTVANARALVDVAGNAKTAANFIPSDENGETTGSLKIKNSAGLSVGIADTEYVVLKIVGTTSTLETQQSGTDFSIKTRVGNQFKDSIYVDSSTERVGIYRNDPSYTLDVDGTFRCTGDAYVDGDLKVSGSATYFNVSKLTVQDKNIELGLLDDSTEGADTEVDGAGIIVRSSEGSKDWTWDNSTKCWTSNQDVNLDVGKEFKINNNSVLSATELGFTVKTAKGLTKIEDTLEYLDVDNINLDGNIISTGSSTDLTINPATKIVNVTTSRITNVVDPSSAQDAATKNYVDTQIADERIIFSLDTTGLADPDVDVKAILENMYPATVAANGKRAVIHCTTYTSATVTGIDIESAMTKSYIDVDKNGVVNDVSVVQDVAFVAASGTITPTPARFVRTYEIQSGVWAQIGTAVPYTP